jgi:hypothetical protein
MRDHGIITGVRAQRGYNEVFGYAPNASTLEAMEKLARRMFNEGSVA